MGFDYTVSGNDKGLTYIFLEQAKNHAGYNANQKIDWTKVMSVFDQVQKEEEAEVQKLFSGGTDKTKAGWGTSYIIKAGDKISLSLEQLNKILSAMGVDVTKGTAPAEETTPTQGSPPSGAEPNPPASDTNPPSSWEDLSNNKAELPLEMLLPNKRYANLSVQNPDGTVYSYDGYGYIKEVFDEYGNFISYTRYDKDGNIVEKRECSVIIRK